MVPVFNSIVTLVEIARELSHLKRTNVGSLVWILQRNVFIKNECVGTKLEYVKLHVTKFGIINTIRSICFCDPNMAHFFKIIKIGAFCTRRILDQFKIHVRLVQNVHN